MALHELFSLSNIQRIAVELGVVLSSKKSMLPSLSKSIAKLTDVLCV